MRFQNNDAFFSTKRQGFAASDGDLIGRFPIVILRARTLAPRPSPRPDTAAASSGGLSVRRVKPFVVVGRPQDHDGAFLIA